MSKRPGDTAGTLSRGKPASEDRRKQRGDRKSALNLPGGQNKKGEELRTSNTVTSNFSLKLILGRVKGQLDNVAVEAWTVDEKGRQVKMDDWNYDKKGKPINPADVQTWIGEITRECAELVSTEARKQMKVIA